MIEASLPSSVRTVVIGGGQAGLVMSWFLGQAGREHIVLERRDRLGGGWQDRWDAFCLVTPNFVTSLPGYPYDGPDPDGFMPRDEIAQRVARYAEVINAPVSTGTEVMKVAVAGDGTGFRVETNRGTVEAREVVVATGGFHHPRVPAAAAGLPARITQLHSHAYRNEAALPPGAVVVVGSGQSGVQLAEELHQAGRRVFLSVGTAGRLPRRYRGRDIFYWLIEQGMRGGELGAPPMTVDKLPDPRIRLAGNAHLSGHDGGHDTNLRQFARDGIALLGHVQGADGERLVLAPDLQVNLRHADAFFDERLRPGLDRFIELAGIDAPPDDRETIDFEPPEIAELDLAAEGVSTILWTSGYRLDFGWLDFPIFDEQGFPHHVRGVSEVPGLYFIGLPWQYTLGSAALLAVASDARFLAERMGLQPRMPALVA